LSSWLLARGEEVVDVPSTPTARVRQLSRGGGRKNDQIDAAAAACAAALQGDGRPLQAEDITDALALLDESRMNLAQSRVRLVNQLHALLRDLPAGRAPTDLSATTAAALLRRVRPSGDAERVRKQIAVGLIGQIRSVDSLLKSNARQVSELVAASGSTLTETVGMGAITAGRLIGRTGRASRFPLGRIRQLRRRGARRGSQRRQGSTPPLLEWRPPTQRRPAHRRHHPDPNTRQPRPHLLQRQTRRGQDPPRSATVPETSPRQPHLANHDHRRTTAGGGPGRAPGGRLCNPARLAQPQPPALRTSHFPDPPTTTLRRLCQPLDKHRGTQGQRPRRASRGRAGPGLRRAQRPAPQNGSDSASRSRRSLTCFGLREEHPAQPPALDHISTSFLIAASPDAAPEESTWRPRSRAAARRNDLLTPTSGNPPSGGEEGAEPGLLNPARAAQDTLHTPASATVALSQEAVCVATTGRIRRSLSGWGVR
jgi:transposase